MTTKATVSSRQFTRDEIAALAREAAALAANLSAAVCEVGSGTSGLASSRRMLADLASRLG